MKTPPSSPNHLLVVLLLSHSLFLSSTSASLSLSEICTDDETANRDIWDALFVEAASCGGSCCRTTQEAVAYYDEQDRPHGGEMWRVCDCTWRVGGGGSGWGGGWKDEGSFSGEVGDCDVAECLEEALERLVRVAERDEDDDDEYTELARLTPAPTLSPTLLPTVAPTFSPTSSPTLVPTSSPTLVPTASPTLAPLQCSEDEKLLAVNDQPVFTLHISVSVSGDTAIVGVPGDGAYVFNRGEDGWRKQAKLTGSDGAAHHLFGSSVSVSGDTAVIGAPEYGSDLARSGSAYVFHRDEDGWSELGKLTASDAAESDEFGYSVAVSGDTAVVGAHWDSRGGDHSGSAYIFVRDDDGWSELVKLTAEDAVANDEFGTSVSVSGDTAIIGAFGHDGVGSNSGSAYVFHRDEDGWSQQAKLTAKDAATSDVFGISVSLSGDTAIIGAYRDDDQALNSGSAYVFHREGDRWSQQAKLTASDATTSASFGYSVAVSGDVVIVGSRDGLPSGSAYIFVRDDGKWSQHAKLTASDAANSDAFGHSVGVSGNTAIIGTNWIEQDDYLRTDLGSAYVFSCM
jgi:nucleoside-specific outer membrane channel protein Tsx